VRRWAVLGACVLSFAAVTTGVSSCGSTGGTSSVTATGSTLTIYASAPANAPYSADLLDAERLAFQQFQSSGTKISKFTVKFAAATASKISDNARTAIEDTGAVAYIGELWPGASAETMGITNAQDLLQVSPTDTAIELTQTTSAVPGAPNDYYESRKTYGRTFARVVPDAAREAKAQVQAMSSLGVKSLYVTSDDSPYGAAVAQAVKSDASGAGLTVSPSKAGADGIFYGGGASSASAFDALASANPTVKLFGPSGLAAAGPPAGDHNVYVSVPGFLPKELPAPGKTFVSDFTSAYGHAPATEAVFGFEAVRAVLTVLQEAGAKASDRATVARDFFGLKAGANSAVGPYSINSSGDTSISPFVLTRSLAGKLVPFRSLQAQG
jgi:ABC-type branched-subunit amino acid transport system substrate-binding protein